MLSQFLVRAPLAKPGGVVSAETPAIGAPSSSHSIFTMTLLSLTFAVSATFAAASGPAAGEVTVPLGGVPSTVLLTMNEVAGPLATKVPARA